MAVGAPDILTGAPLTMALTEAGAPNTRMEVSLITVQTVVGARDILTAVVPIMVQTGVTNLTMPNQPIPIQRIPTIPATQLLLVPSLPLLSELA